jgi:cyclophilin family peptidyl-prolyl cis-trans isomerase
MQVFQIFYPSKFLATLAMALFITACGGSTGFAPEVTGVKVQSMQYGKLATIYIGGKDLRSSLKVDTGGVCTNPNIASDSTTETLVLNCVPSKAGDFSLIIQSPDGQTIYSTVVNVPLPQVTLITSKGSITVELYPASAPSSTNNFLAYVRKGFYRGTLFHRVIPNFVVQGGGYTTGMVKKTDQAAPIELESNKGLSNLRGTLAMARTNLPNSATSEFYINLVDNVSLDFKNTASPGYAVFGKVIQGMELVDAIALEPTGVVGGMNDVPLTEIALSLALQTK